MRHCSKGRPQKTAQLHSTLHAARQPLAQTNSSTAIKRQDEKWPVCSWKIVRLWWRFIPSGTLLKGCTYADINLMAGMLSFLHTPPAPKLSICQLPEPSLEGTQVPPSLSTHPWQEYLQTDKFKGTRSGWNGQTWESIGCWPSTARPWNESYLKTKTSLPVSVHMENTVKSG